MHQINSSEYWIKILSNLKKFPTILRLFPTYGRGHKPNLPRDCKCNVNTNFKIKK